MDWQGQEYTENTPSFETEIQEPKDYKVIFLNDDYTTMDFVVAMLVTVFHKTELEAVELMEKVHKTGSAIVGVFSYDIALTKSRIVMENARRNGFPLRVEVEEL
jgi:ATP-dependent Clp protease adaptor protein ClpS